MSAAFLGRIWYVDPLHLWHKPFVCEEEIFPNMRFAAAGIIRNYDFDSVLLGTSMLENTSAKEAGEVLGGKFFNLSISGSRFIVRKLVLRHLFKHKKLKKVIYSLDAHIEPDNGLKGAYPITRFDFLYDKNLFNDLSVYINDKFIKNIFTLNKKCKKSDFDRPKAWYKLKELTNRFGGFQNWIKNKQDKQISDALKFIKGKIKIIKTGKKPYYVLLNGQLAASETYFYDCFLSFVQNNPQTEFILVIPPYSTLKHALDIRTGDVFVTFKEFVRYLIEQSAKYPNLKVYAWGDMDFTDDIANYKDLTHYHEKINSQMLVWIRDGVGLLTPENFDDYYERFEKKVREYDYMQFYEQIKDLKLD